VDELELVAPIEGSALALSRLRLGAGEAFALREPERDSLLYAFSGEGTLTLEAERHPLGAGAAALVLAAEAATLKGGDDGLEVVLAGVGPETDRHAPLGPREAVVRREEVEAGAATGARSFQILFGPHNGSTRATLFVGYIPPGKAPWHYHLYDEIVWVPEGPGRLHFADAATELGPGAAFRLRPRQVHIVENASPGRELVVLGVFTPAGSPSAAYLTPDVAAEYGFAG
jgi:quercetin dioxygenase-like cupin family protein